MNVSLLNTSLVRALLVLTTLAVIGLLAIPNFLSGSSVRSMLVLAAFLGIAAVGQSITALVGSIDLSIPFVIGMANVALAQSFGKGMSAPVAIAWILAVAVVIGLVNGLLTDVLELPALVLTLAVGFTVSGGIQVWTRGNVTGGAPDWLIELTGVQGRVAGVPVPPLVVVWLVIAAAVILMLRRSAPGIAVYALGSSRAAAERSRLRARACWVGLYVLSAVAAATAGMLLLGFTTGGFADVGKPYLFSTVAAVVIGGTSLLGGKGGYGLTIIGSLSLVALTTILLGAGLSSPAQQVVLGVAIIAMVSLYGREPALTARV